MAERDLQDIPFPADPSNSDAERLSLALAAARLGDWSWDAATDLVTMSPRAAAIFDIPPGPQMTWAAMRGLLHPDDRERARLAVEEAVAGHKDYATVYRLTNGGRERWVAASGRARYDADGRAVGMLGIVQDRTREYLLATVDEALRPLLDPREITLTAARILGAHVEANRCAYATVEDDEDAFLLEGNYTNGTHSIVGRYRFRQFGAECLRLMRAGAPYVVTDARRDPRIEPADLLAYEKTAIRAVICVPILKGARFVAAMAVHLLTPRDWETEEVELVQRVASRCWESIERARVERDRERLLESERDAREAAESANRAKDEFMAMLGHELRNPLSPILTALQLMKMRGDGTTDRERAVIERQVEHLTRLVDDLLDVSRIARGKVDLAPERVELAQIVARSIEMASPLLEQRVHSLTAAVPRAGIPVWGDLTRLSQVVGNLLTNAAKYTPPGGRILVAGSCEGAVAVLRVKDSGVGIPADMLPKVFDLFVQGRQQSDRQLGGLGLGLSIVRSLVERHGGTVEAHSEGVGHGSEFVVRLPLAVDAATAPILSAPNLVQAPARAPARVLVVDDSEDGAEMLAQALRLGGYETAVANDGPQALALCATFTPDVALLDLGLPVMDGYELATRLRELPGLAGLRLIAVSGYGQDKDRERTRAAGFRRHLVKPVEFRRLEEALAEAEPDPA